mmetsp:Transcript_3875/g.4294  ORF Transcript_3875/g.4294 Transcript_3875/m.4294 type:complete len:470 (+) Transcript_3875:28-1437(+)
MQEERRVSSIVLALINIFGGIIFGYNTGIVAMCNKPVANDFGYAGTDSESAKQGIFTGAVVLGAAIGSVGGGIFSDWLGRRWTMVITGAVSTIGVLLTVIAPSYWPLVIFRVILGLGVGLTSVACPVYVGEMAPDKRRGVLNSLFQVSLTIGIVIAYIFGFGLLKYNLSDSFRWRTMLAGGVLPSVHLLIMCLFMPESDQWLRRKAAANKKKEQKLNLTEDGPLINTGAYESQPSSSLVKTLKGLWSRPEGTVCPSVVIGTVLAFALQLTGINAIIYYAPQVLQGSVKFGSLSADDNESIATILVGVWNFLSTLFALGLVDFTGRKPLMLIGLILMTIGNVGTGLVFKFLSAGGAKTGLSILGIVLFIGGFELGPGALFWVLLAEIFPGKVRDVGNSYVNMLQWSLNLLLSIVFPIVRGDDNQNLPYVFFFFGALALLCLGFVFFFVPETKGKNLEKEVVSVDGSQDYD